MNADLRSYEVKGFCADHTTCLERLAIIETNAKANFAARVDAENRLRGIETKLNLGIGVLVTLQIVVPILIQLISNHA